MLTARQLIEAARRYQGTPFAHQGRCRGAGIDCVGLIICSCHDCGLDLRDQLRAAGFTDDVFARYRRDGDRPTFERMVAAIADPVPIAREGNVLVFKIPGARAPHAAFKTSRGMLHAWDRLGRVAEHRIDEWWSRVIHSAWQIRGVA